LQNGMRNKWHRMRNLQWTDDDNRDRGEAILRL